MTHGFEADERMEDQPTKRSRGLVSYACSGDRLLATMFLVLSLAYGAGTFSFHQTMSSDVVGPAYFPRILAITGAALALLHLVRGRRQRAAAEEPTGAQSVIASVSGELWPIGLVLGYALLITPLGFIPSTFLFFTVTMVALGESLRSALIYGVVATIVLFVLFFAFLKAELPMGTWIPLERIVPQINDLRHLLF